MAPSTRSQNFNFNFAYHLQENIITIINNTTFSQWQSAVGFDVVFCPSQVIALQ